MKEALVRTALLIGEAGLDKLQNAFVAVIGLGGVGGHAAEALARAGIGRMLLVDCDIVQESNLNRQQFATKETLGMPKTCAAMARIQSVSDCRVETMDLRIDRDTVAQLPKNLTFLIDAIDSLPGKSALVAFAQENDIEMVSCMGAGNRLDASRFCVRDIYQTEHCPLARRMRQTLRRMGVASLPVVCSDETATLNQGERTVGSLAPVTGAAGLVAASYALNRILYADQRYPKQGGTR